MSNIGNTHGTTIPSGKDIQRKWFVIDAAGKTLGRLSTVAASILAGKLNPLYTPYIDMGDHVIVVNCEKIVLTGMKGDQKLYRRYTGFPGGLREESFIKLLAPPDGHQAEGLQGRQAPALCPAAAAARFPRDQRREGSRLGEARPAHAPGRPRRLAFPGFERAGLLSRRSRNKNNPGL
jgi:ribosomal protein L13